MEMQLVGMSARMSLVKNTTFALWNRFMPQQASIQNRKGNDLYSVQVFGKEYYTAFDPSREFEKWATVAVSHMDTIPEGMTSLTITAGEYAVFLHKGLPSGGAKTFQYIFQEWFPTSGFEIDIRPQFEVLGAKYRNDSPDSEEEIYIPIRRKN